MSSIWDESRNEKIVHVGHGVFYVYRLKKEDFASRYLVKLGT